MTRVWARASCIACRRECAVNWNGDLRAHDCAHRCGRCWPWQIPWCVPCAESMFARWPDLELQPGTRVHGSEAHPYSALGLGTIVARDGSGYRVRWDEPPPTRLQVDGATWVQHEDLRPAAPGDSVKLHGTALGGQ